MVKIIDVEAGSIAEELGMKIGDEVSRINNKEISDALDYRFYIANEEIELLIQREEESILFEIEKEYNDDLGIVVEDLKMRSCGNNCIFCFVYQNPKKLRKSLYFKDEDYRFSFLYGHYTTLTNTSMEDLERIVEQRLAPLYISVHVTEPEMRKLMLGIKFDDRLFEKIDYLTKHNIELNCQIVLCPGLNDGRYLDQTITDLKQYFPMIRSIAIVPVGLTKHRKNLYRIIPVSHAYSIKAIVETDERRKKLRNELGSSFVYLSDEFYIRTKTPIPDASYYEGFYQLENGVGLTRDFMDSFDAELPDLLNFFYDRKIGLTLVTGDLGNKVLRRYFAPKLDEINNIQYEVQTVVNQFYGPSIVVSGLLVGQDIYNTLSDKNLLDYIVLPPNCLNDDGLFLDDWTADQLEERLGKKIFVFPDSFLELFKQIQTYETTFSNDYR